MTKSKYIIIYSIAASFLLSAINNGSDALINLRFHLGIFDKGKEINRIKESVKEYNGFSASFYNTAGESIAGLDFIPASKLLKRRFFLDINQLKTEGLVMIFDKDSAEVKNVYFINSRLAVAESEETWAVSVQKIKTREPIFNLKAVQSRERYVLRKGTYPNMPERWIVHQADVYTMSEEIPKPDMGPVL